MGSPPASNSAVPSTVHAEEFGGRPSSITARLPLDEIPFVEHEALADQPPSPVPPQFGWNELEAIPAWSFLPSVWPAEHRRWVEPDGVVLREHHWIHAGRGPVVVERPWSEEDRASLERDRHEYLEQLGLSQYPGIRRWFLRLPPGQSDLLSYMQALFDLASEQHATLGTSAFAAIVTTRIAADFSTDPPSALHNPA